VSFDVDTDEATLSGIIEDIYLNEGGTATLPRAVSVSTWHVSEGDDAKDNQIQLRIIRPGESEGITFPTNLDVGRNRYRAIAIVLEIPLDQPGILTFELLLNANHTAYHRVTVHPPGARAKEGIDLKPPPATSS
jgi:hypothetical protein